MDILRVKVARSTLVYNISVRSESACYLANVP